MIIIIGVLMAAAIELLAAMFFGWFFMLGIGVIHHEWISGCPTIGYWWAVLITYLLRMAFLHIDKD